MIRRLVWFYQQIKVFNSSDVYFVSILIAMVKINELTEMRIEPGFYIFIIFLGMFHVCVVWFNPFDIVQVVPKKRDNRFALLKTKIYLVLALIFLAPAYLLPMMPVYKFSIDYINTIFDGIFGFFRTGDYLLAFVIFFCEYLYSYY